MFKTQNIEHMCLTLILLGHITNFLFKTPHQPMSVLCPQPPRLCYNRVAQYTFDESNVLDDNTFSSGESVNGTAQFDASGKFNSALILPGDRYVAIRNRERFDFTARGLSFIHLLLMLLFIIHHRHHHSTVFV
jgi:hypothetical protein